MATRDVGDIHIHYHRQGSGPPLVLVSGFLAGGNIWDMVVAELRQTHSCLVFDNRGIGGSSAPHGPYAIPMLATDLDGLLGELDISRPVVVGHSMGGFIAMELALTGRRKPSRLILVSTASSGRPELPGMSEVGRRAVFNPRGPRREIIDGILAVGLGERIHRRAPERIEIFRQLLDSARPNHAGYLGQKAAVETFDAGRRIGNIRCPCQVVHGADDSIIPPASGERLTAKIPGADLTVLKGVGHFPQIESPATLSAIIRRVAT